MHSKEQVGKFIVPTRVHKGHAEMGSQREGDLESEKGLGQHFLKVSS